MRQVALDRVRPCAFQPRKEFSAETLQELADSIKQQGILQPLIVRDAQSHFELIAGERRWRAAQLAGLKEVPVIVRTGVAEQRARLLVPAHAQATTRIQIGQYPREAVVNDGSVPESDFENNTFKIPPRTQ